MNPGNGTETKKDRWLLNTRSKSQSNESRQRDWNHWLTVVWRKANNSRNQMNPGNGTETQVLA